MQVGVLTGSSSPASAGVTVRSPWPPRHVWQCARRLSPGVEGQGGRVTVVSSVVIAKMNFFNTVLKSVCMLRNVQESALKPALMRADIQPGPSSVGAQYGLGCVLWTDGPGTENSRKSFFYQNEKHSALKLQSRVWMEAGWPHTHTHTQKLSGGGSVSCDHWVGRVCDTGAKSPSVFLSEGRRGGDVCSVSPVICSEELESQVDLP